MRYYFKVKYGFGATDYVVVDKLEELEKAVYAKVEKVTAFIGGKMIDGKYIISIEPDIHSYTGWQRGYEPKTGSDFQDIKRSVPKDADKVLEIHYRHVAELIDGGQVEKIGNTESLPELTDGK